MKSNPTMDLFARGSEPSSGRAGSSAEPLGQAETARMVSLGTLAAGVAHEINNPLSYLLGNLDLGLSELRELRARMEGRPSEELEHVSGVMAALDGAREGAERVRNIVRDLLDFARPSSSSADAVDVEAVLDATIRVAWNDIRHRARLVKGYAGLLPVRGDEARLGQVFLNLLMNAAQAVEGEPATNTIRVSTRSEQGAAAIEISDTGRGIRESELSRVFEPFYTTKAAGTGVGLGLAICRTILAGFGGEISVSSELGHGTTFKVVLPYALEERAARRAAEDAISESEPVPSRILIIDDEPLLGQTLRYAFKGRHDVTICTSGREGLSRLEQDWGFDLVLCDLMMPDVSGAAVYEAVKRTHPELLRRFVFMTGGAFTERARDFLAQHQGAQLEKPFNLGEIERLLRQLDAPGAKDSEAE